MSRQRGTIPIHDNNKYPSRSSDVLILFNLQSFKSLTPNYAFSWIFVTLGLRTKLNARHVYAKFSSFIHICDDIDSDTL